MELRLTVFQRRIERFYHWYTIGLGPHNVYSMGADLARVHQRTVDALTHQWAKLLPSEFEPFEFVPGRRLVDEMLEFSIAAEERQVRFRGAVPLVIEPRGRKDEPLSVVFHPMRPHEWFVHEPDRELAKEAGMFFRQRWSGLTIDELDALKCIEKDGHRLRIIAINVKPKALDTLLKPPKKASDFALAGEARVTGTALLNTLGRNLTFRASEGQLHTGMPREPYRTHLQQLLCGRQKTPTVLVGPSGAGKSTLIRQGIVDLLEAEGYYAHRNLSHVHQVWAIEGRRIIAGMSYLGQWEQRCVDLIAACRRHKAILWIGDLASWGRIGQVRGSERSLATLFRGAIARGEVIVIAECSQAGLQRLRDDAPEFAETLTPMFVEPSGRTETMQMLMHEARMLEVEHGVIFDPPAFRSIYELGSRLGAGHALPGRVLEVLRGLAAGDYGRELDFRDAEEMIAQGRKIEAIKLVREAKGWSLKAAKTAVERYMDTGRWPTRSEERISTPISSRLDTKSEDKGTESRIAPFDVVTMLSKQTGMPVSLLAPDHALDPQSVEQALQGQIMGQPNAVEAMRDLVMRVKARLVDPGRPYGVFLFTGPTGTGKTEMAKCVAEYLFGAPQRLVRFDMSEYNGPGASARLIGDRIQPHGALTSVIQAQPFSVVLLDEIEKADPSVLNLLLQLFDDGRLTDANGVQVAFQHTVIIMTSNLGARTSSSVGFEDDGSQQALAIDSEVRSFFPPELFNRIDQVVPFSPLSESAAKSIARREITRLLERRGLTERNVFVRVTPSVIDLVATVGFAQQDGARSLKRYLEDHVGAYLADHIACVPSASARTFWLYQRQGDLALKGYTLQEADTGTIDGRFEAMVNESRINLIQHIPAMLARVDALLASRAWELLERSLIGSLHRFSRGDERAGDHVYDLERYREELNRLKDELQLHYEYDPRLHHIVEDDMRVESEGELVQVLDFGSEQMTQPTSWRTSRRIRRERSVGPTRLPLSRHRDLIDTFAAVAFWERTLEHAQNPEEHTILIELTRVSRSAGTSRFEAKQPGLLEWYAEAILRSRGDVELLAVSDDEGRVEERNPAHGFQTAYRQIALRVNGPGIRSFFVGEEGCQIRDSLTGGTEVIRIVVLSGTELDPLTYLLNQEARRERFIEALEASENDASLPDDPDRLLPVIRRIQFDQMDVDANGVRPATWVDVEDYPLGYVYRGKVKQLADVFSTLWLLRLGATNNATGVES